MVDLRHLNAYWHTVVDTIQEGVLIVDPQGTITSVNRGFEEITGYTREEIVGRSCATLKCTACEITRPTGGGHWCMMFEKGRLQKQKCRMRRKDGQTVHVVKNGSVLKDEGGVVGGAVETITDISDLVASETRIESCRRELDAQDRFCGMTGRSPAMRRVFELIAFAARSDAPALITGESGTGKELVARAIHETGLRKRSPYITVDGTALTESLLEGELFGHVEGAFNAAPGSRQGRFAAAAGGDIFINEIGALSLSMQIKLLRALEHKVIERVGGRRPIRVDVRVLSASQRNLQRLIARGALRSDFFRRINAIAIHLPPLRERIEDIPLLARCFVDRIRMKNGQNIEGISSRALELLMRYHWPGNVRELKNALEFAFLACQEAAIRPEHLPPNVLDLSLIHI